MDKNYLITYWYTNSEGMSDSDFAWFENYEELNAFIEGSKLNGREVGLEDFDVIEIIKINSCEILFDKYKDEE